jgi:Mlc titration factor MtfA (ptsG expression regulator)
MNAALYASLLMILVVAVFIYRSLHKPGQYIVPKDVAALLAGHVAFYDALSPGDKKLFEERVNSFLSSVAIRGVDTEVEDLDRVLVAAGAIIPIFAFPDWRYNNLSAVLLYKDTFGSSFETEGRGRNVLGMVGDGALHRQMLLSRPSLRSSFAGAGDGHNTPVHEFAHLIDKADGATDGIPEYLLSQPYVLPWISLMHRTIGELKEHWSDIDSYAATSDAEFFAVVSEYFFERPGELKIKHPELYSLLERMFHH